MKERVDELMLKLKIYNPDEIGSNLLGGMV